MFLFVKENFFSDAGDSVIEQASGLIHKAI